MSSPFITTSKSVTPKGPMYENLTLSGFFRAMYPDIEPVDFPSMSLVLILTNPFRVSILSLAVFNAVTASSALIYVGTWGGTPGHV